MAGLTTAGWVLWRRLDCPNGRNRTIIIGDVHGCEAELVEMLRRFVLVGLMVVVYNGSMVQIVLGTLFSAIFLLVQVLSRTSWLSSTCR